MHPVVTIVEWHGIARPIGSYGVMLTLALLVGSSIAVRSAQRAGLDVGALIAALAGAVGAGFVGACVFSTLVLWPFVGSVSAALAQPGLVFYGGLVAGAVGLFRCAQLFGLPPAATLDSMLPALPIAHAIGRIGCLLGGCCYGAPTSLPWGVHHAAARLWTWTTATAAIPADVARHPWPLYEALGLIGLAWVFRARRGFSGLPGQRAAGYVAAYACLRFVLEPLRGDPVRGVWCGGLLSSAQLISLLLLFVGGLWSFWHWRPVLARARTAR
jgi:phosphatidylglycerol:prolipoprotein diacylglycerol transferase